MSKTILSKIRTGKNHCGAYQICKQEHLIEWTEVKLTFIESDAILLIHGRSSKLHRLLLFWMPVDDNIVHRTENGIVPIAKSQRGRERQKNVELNWAKQWMTAGWNRIQWAANHRICSSVPLGSIRAVSTNAIVAIESVQGDGEGGGVLGTNSTYFEWLQTDCVHRWELFSRCKPTRSGNGNERCSLKRCCHKKCRTTKCIRYNIEMNSRMHIECVCVCAWRSSEFLFGINEINQYCGFNSIHHRTALTDAHLYGSPAISNCST